MNTNKDFILTQIRQLFADYKASEGCSCCQDGNAHKESEEKLAKILNVKKYKDGSGYDWTKYQTIYK